VEKGKRKNRQNPKRAVQNVFTSLAAFAAAAALVLCLVVCGELFEKPDTLRHAALMMTDLDNLKTINDTYGHDWGDIYLRQTAHSLRQNSPGGTVVARPAAEPGAIDEKAAEVIAEVERQKAEREEAGS
jgi:GGDEF domain-containing protein